ncbi:TrmB family transcriptional regulator sugar-binding domain-containing protein [Bacterioplanoides sp. SCSIO 12839]|uniref:TrmB family transcriptional regulator sugar-binding domain-containing protein n=1 Tax=Bacterioplanoides sp. SCSIO 12839 TaxID=2829569 RepID=UPI002106C8B5|nr:TrmB family transcriptional regulator sugar-binding domain-containing protein [Bacterioplanoides sp. SCSIO 12839]
MEQIKIRQDEFSIDYRDEQLPALFCHQDSDCDFSTSGVIDLEGFEALRTAINSARLTLLIASDLIKSEEIIELLQQTADRGVRVYLLVGEPKRNKTAIDALSGRCLIRTGVEQKGALMLVDHSTTAPTGMLIMNSAVFEASDSKAWAVELEEKQIEDCFRSFCKLFWESSSSECLNEASGAFQNTHPDGVIVTNHSHHLVGSLGSCIQASLQSLTAISYRDHYRDDAEEPGAGLSDYRMLLSSQSKNIAIAARDGVALTDSSIPSLILSEEGNWLLPDEADFSKANWCLRLSKRESQSIHDAYDLAIDDAAWHYKSDFAMQDIASNQQVRFADNPGDIQNLKEKRARTLEAISTGDIDQFLNESAQALAGDSVNWQQDFMAYQVDYEVDIHPPYAPSQAVKDDLYSHWDDAETDWKKRLQALEGKLISINEKQQSIPDRLTGFIKSFLLGQNQSVKSINRELDALKDWSVTAATPAGRLEYTGRIDKLMAEIDKRGSETAAKIDEAEQHSQWLEKKKDLECKQSKKSEVVDSKESAREKLKSEKEMQLEDIDKQFLSQWAGAFGNLNDKQLAGVKLPSFLHGKVPVDTEEGSNSEALDKVIVMSRMTIEQAKQWKGEIKNSTWKKHYKAFEGAMESRERSINQLDRKIKEAEQMLEKAQLDLEAANVEIADHGSEFSYKPKKDSLALEKLLGIENQSKASSIFTWPDEELPAEDTELRTHAGKRYLVISTTEQLAEARKDAKRLAAKIVCDREQINA